ncbi:unnamed protein product [Phyllotreta striolata]|uniref:Equilibrative nucleoside transporter 3 n=1 Tax=Phyllotreta striolata TaxID=444603 RepID=A0A9N9XUQ8_PHYSR|nr:unnamed protein product [Phyllotreta striolata]
MDIDYHLKRASLLSEQTNDFRPSLRKISEEKSPPDKFHLAALFSFFNGMAGMIPLTFFLTANDYWMHKLRDTRYENYDLNNKTTLQQMFTSVSTTGTSVPSVVTVILSMLYGAQFDLRKRFVFTLGIVSSMFIVFTILVEVDTDSWQTTFFILTIGVLCMISAVQPLFGITSMSFLSRLPVSFMHINLYGTTIGGLFGSTLQIISLSVGKNSTEIAMIYFTCGTVVMCFTLILAYLIKYSPVVTFYMKTTQDVRPKRHSLKEYKKVMIDIWPIIVILILPMLTMGLGHPNITNLVTSEHYDKNGENLWYDKYFVAVATFFMFDVTQLIGRFFGRAHINENNYWWYIGVTVIKTVFLTPLYLFCNALPRHHLSVWFPHDYQYNLIHFSNCLLLGILLTNNFLSVPNFAKENTELAYKMITTLLIIIASVSSLLNPLIVRLL